MEQPITIVSRLTVNPGMEELLREELLRIVDLSRREIVADELLDVLKRWR